MKTLQRPLQRLKYLLCDGFCAQISWLFFFGFRKWEEGFRPSVAVESIFNDPNYWIGCGIIPLFWFLLHVLHGYYHHIYRKTILQDFSDTLKVCLLGSLLLFFIIVLDDYIHSYTDYYIYFSILFLSYFIPCFTFRCLLTKYTHKRIRHKKIGFNTLLIGSGPQAQALFHTVQNEKRPHGNHFVGYMPISNQENISQKIPLSQIGNINQIGATLKLYKIEEVYIIPEHGEEESLPLILSQCIANYLVIKIKPTTQNLLLGAVRSYDVHSQPFIKLSFERMAFWQRGVRRVAEIISCSLALILLSPLLIYTAYKVRRSSPGPVFYQQERLGLHGKPFQIYKFRSMCTHAEQDIPLLTTQKDPRVTLWGKKMRKYRIDELPQLYNVLKGDMALVGPRPERAYFVEQIVKKAPHYRLLFNVKPGLTSWGETQYGYAENIGQMIERMAYDLVYLENQSLGMDLKILLYTIGVVFRGEGK